MTALVLIALMIGGGTTLAAEYAIPGDLLYPVKTEVNENLKGALALGGAAEGRLQARLVQERLLEAEELAAKGRLTAEAATSLSARIKEHFDTAAEMAAEGDIDSSAAVQASLEGSLRGSFATLTALNASVPGNNAASLLTHIRTHADIASRAQADVVVDAESEKGVKDTLDHAERILERAKDAVEDARDSLSAEAHARIEAGYKDAVSAHAEAKARVGQEAHLDAYRSAQRAIREATEALTQSRSMVRLHALGNASLGDILGLKTDVSGSAEDHETSSPADEKNITVDARTGVDADTPILDTGTEATTSLRIGL